LNKWPALERALSQRGGRGGVILMVTPTPEQRRNEQGVEIRDWLIRNPEPLIVRIPGLAKPARWPAQPNALD
jgi:hypothetical protein